MSATTTIEWAQATWNPVTGCTEVSPGCDHCYAKTFAERFRGTPGHYFEHGFDVQLRPDKLTLPLKWRKPKRIFVNSMSDLFHKDVPDEYIARVFGVMALAGHHTFQLLTKRHARMRALLSDPERLASLDVTLSHWINDGLWPLRNVCVGVSTENQRWADIRIPALLDTPAAVRWISAEPLLGPIDVGVGDPHAGHDSDNVNGHPHPLVCLDCSTHDHEVEYYRRDPGAVGIDWVVCGGESGPGARPMHPDWVRSLRDQCVTAGVPFLYKQWGQYAPVLDRPRDGDVWVDHAGTVREWVHGDGHFRDGVGDYTYGGLTLVRRARAKSDAGRELDGRSWDEYPTVAS